MNPFLKNIAAIVLGIVTGSAVNMGIILVSGSIIPLPEGADNTTMEGLKASMHLFEAKHFVFPFLAHAIGTLVGAYVTAYIALSHKLKMALCTAVFFLIGGVMNLIMLPSPAWFAILDAVGAYLPMGWIAAKLRIKKDGDV